ncbi:MAG TPA: peptide MFS transporter [Gemmatimonadaceae bacterium]
MSQPTLVDVATTATDRPPVLDDRWLLGHPRGLGLLFAAEMWERFSFYGMRALLVLYLVNYLKWDTPRATSLYGTYNMLVYLMPLIGGYLADRFIGTRRSLVIGAIIISLGHFTLAMPGMTTFYIGLGLIIIGTGFFKPNVSTMVGQIYREGDTRRDAGFTIFYMGINLGAFLGPIICGYLAQTPGYGWHWGFAAAGVGMVLGLIVYLALRDKYLPGIGLAPEQRAGAQSAAERAAAAEEKGNPAHAIGGAIVGGVLAWLLGGGGILAPFVGAVVGAAIGLTVLGTRGEERRRVIALFVVFFFVVFFWAAYEQAGSSMSLFADKFTNLQLGSLRLRSSWFQSVNPAVILIFAPVFAWLWVKLGERGREPSTPMKMVLGLTFLGLGFVVLMIGGSHADAGAKVSPLWLVGAFTFHTWGELCLSPVGLSYVTKVAPWRFASMLMGAWFMALAVAEKLAGWLAGFTPTPGEAPAHAARGIGGYLQHVSATNHGFFSIFFVSSIVAALVMLLFVPLLKRLTAAVRA